MADCKPVYKGKKYDSIEDLKAVLAKEALDPVKFTKEVEDKIVDINDEIRKLEEEQDKLEAEEAKSLEPKQEETEQPITNTFTPAFTGKISQDMFTEDMVMVFGANSVGGHGQGVAALAYANTIDNYRKWNPNLVKDIQNNKVGDFAIAGKTGLSQGTKGLGYGLVTKEASVKNGRLVIGKPLNYVELDTNIEKLYNTARENPDKTFVVPYNDDNNLNKSNLNQLANRFGSRLIPANVKFGDKMLAEIKRVKGENVFEQPTQPKQETTQQIVKDLTTPKNIFSVTPIQSVDKKAKVKASIATKYIGFGEGISNSSTEHYRKQAGEFANTGTYDSQDIAFVSIGGKRGNPIIRKREQDKTIKEAIKAIEQGATLITDNVKYIHAGKGKTYDYNISVADFIKNKDLYNLGEKRLYENLKAKGYSYSETVVDNQTLGVWNKNALEQQTETIKPKVDSTSKEEIDSTEEVETPKDFTKEKEELQNKIDELKVEKAKLNTALSYNTSDLMSNNDPNGIKYFKNNVELKGPRWSEELQMTLPGQVFLPMNIVKDIPGHENMSGRELLEIIGEENLKDIIGYRIPNQGFSSIDSLEVVGILPKSYGDMIMTYTEVPAKTGSDFDVDKMFVMTPNLKYNSKTNKIEKIEFDEDTSEEGVKKRYNNYVNRYVSKKYGKELDEILKKDHAEAWEINKGYAKALGDMIELYKDVTDKEEYDRILDEMAEVRESKLNGYQLFLEKKQEVIDNEEVESLEDYSKKNIYEQNSDKAVQNKLIDLYNSILKSSATHTEAVTPLDADYLQEDAYLKAYISKLTSEQYARFKKLSKEEQVRIAKEQSGKTKDLEFYSPINQFKIKVQNAAGKTGTGQASNHLVHHTYAQLSNLAIKQDIGLGDTTDLSRKYTLDESRLINQVVSAYLNAYVDNAKDPYISMINNNSYTANTVFYLLRSGLSAEMVNTFMSQPIIKDLVKYHNYTQSKLLDPNIAEKWVLNVELDSITPELKLTADTAITKTIESIASKLTSNAKDYKYYIEALAKRAATSNTNFSSKSMSEQNLIKNLTAEKTEDFYEQQMEILGLFLKVREGAKVLSDIMKISKADTNGAYGSFTEQIAIKETKRKLEEQGNVLNLDRLLEETSVGFYTENTLDLSNALYADKMMYASEGFTSLLRGVYKEIKGDYEYLTDDDLNKLVANEYYKYISSKIPLFDMNDEKRAYLFKTLPTKLRELKEKYNNGFLNELYIDRDDKTGLSFIKLASAKISEPETNKILIEEWLNALESNDAELQELAEDLIAHSYFSSGFKKTGSSFYDVIPMSWFDLNKKTEFSSTFKQAINELSSSEGVDRAFMDQLVQHNPTNKLLTKKLSKKTPIDNIGAGKIAIARKHAKPLKLRVNEDGNVVIRKYVYKKETPDVVSLYKYEGFDPSVGKNGSLIYGKIPVLGYNNKGNRLVQYKYQDESPTTIVSFNKFKPSKPMKSNTDMKSYSKGDLKLVMKGGNKYGYKGIDAIFEIYNDETTNSLVSYVTKANGKDLRLGNPIEFEGTFQNPKMLIGAVTEYLNTSVGKEWLQDILNKNC